MTDNAQIRWDVVVVGGGPAGCASAIAVARRRWKTLLIDRGLDGGFLGRLGSAGDFPGFPGAIGGREIVERMRQQAEAVGVRCETEAVCALAAGPESRKVRSEGGSEFEGRTVIVATGAASRSQFLQNEQDFLGRGVFHDVQMDGPMVAGLPAAVVGKNRRAAEEVLLITRFAERIHFIIPSSKLDVDEALLRRLQDHPAVELHFSASLKRINGEDAVSSVTILAGGQEKELPVAGVFTYVHDYQPTSGFMKGVVEMGEGDAIKVDAALSTTSDGVFACGDVLCGRPQFPMIAVAQGLLAGISADRYLLAKGEGPIRGAP